MLKINNVKEFLNYVQGKNHGVIKVHKHINEINRKSMVRINESQIEQENLYGDIYFVPNLGGDTRDKITSLKSIYIDLDAGRDENGNYYPKDIVDEYKIKKQYEIDIFPISPTFIIETRNGLHCHWNLKGDNTLEEWELCIEKLIEKFNSDKSVNHPARLMRLPFTKWMKDKNNPFDIKITSFNNKKYTIKEILDNLKDMANREKKVTYKSIILNKCDLFLNENNHVKLIKNNQVEKMQKALDTKKIVFENQQEFYDYITQEIDLFQFLGINKTSFNCIFHDDSNPSAGIFISKTNQYLYKCHSDKCNFVGNIIRCVERIKNCNRVKAIDFIKKVYQLEIKVTDWQKQQQEILQENKRMIRNGELEEFYPDIYKILKRYDNLLYLFHDIAIDHVRDKKYTDSDDNIIFFVSLKTLQKELNLRSHRKIPDRVGVLAFLGLINKLHRDEIPEDDLIKALRVAERQKEYVYDNLKNKNIKMEDIFIPIVNYYSIPSYCDKNLQKCLDRADLYKENNLTITGWSKEMLQRTFGDEIANEVYPQFEQRKITESSEGRTIRIHQITLNLIETKGYARESDIVQSLKRIYGKTLTKTLSKIQIKRSLQEMLDAYGLKRIRANKELKKKYNVDTPGYPFLIVKKEEC